MTRAKPPGLAQSVDGLDVVGADANNLKNVDLRIPAHGVTVVTGVSGSGKSSLLADTLAMEADRRMRTFLGLHLPHLEGSPPRAFLGPMPPALHVAQRSFRASARTTVGTATGLLTTLRRLFVAHAKPYSDELGRDVPQSSPESYAAWLVNHYRGKLTAWAVPVRFVATDGVRQVARLRENGIEEIIIRSETDSVKAWEKGRSVSIAKFKPLSSQVKHIIEARIGSIEIKTQGQQKAVETLLKQAFDAGQGRVVIELPSASQPELQGPFGPRLDAALHLVDPGSAAIFFPPNTHLLSFNSPEHEESGACKTCLGLGRASTLALDALVPHPERSMAGGAFSLWNEKNYRYVNILHDTIEGLRGLRGFSPDVPWGKLPAEAHRLILDGAGSELITDKDPKTGKKTASPRLFEGFRKAILERVARGTKMSDSLRHLVLEGDCPDCGGSRWSPQARALRVAGLGIHDLLAISFTELMSSTAAHGALTTALPAQTSLVGALHTHAASFLSVGLGHLSGDRGMLEVSEGEGRRARLAAVLNSRHAGLCLLLDEPARGLHDEDVLTMASSIADLGRRHMVVVNEHRHALNKTADHVIELGPGAGPTGGEITYAGPVKGSSWAKESSFERRRVSGKPAQGFLTIHGASIHTLHEVECRLPLGRLTCLTGVSGSGKSSFVRGILVPAVSETLAQQIEPEEVKPHRGTWSRVEGAGRLKSLVMLDQRSPSPNRRSIVATFLELADSIRSAFGATEQARQVHLSPGDFGLNAGSGRCQFCLGIGEVADQEQWARCPVCGGGRFGQEALSVRIEGQSIGQLLDAPVSDLLSKIPSFLSTRRPLLNAMSELGIGHLTLGRRVDTLSGGEIQRLRIAAKLAYHEEGALLFVLDEPAAGLHPQDVERLVRALDRILDGGRNTVVLVEHNPAIIRAADWLVEFGPGSGPRGGRIVAEGPPGEVAKTDTATGRVLAGRSSPARPGVQPEPPAPPLGAPADRVAQAEHMRSWMKHLMGYEVAPPEPTPASPERPLAILDERSWRGRRVMEMGDLDRELSKLLLDIHVHETNDDGAKLAALWAEVPEAKLVLQPFLHDMRVWGRDLPSSTVASTIRHVEAMGLGLVTLDGKPYRQRPSADVSGLRATGERFAPRGSSAKERLPLVLDALALGGGYVELLGPHKTTHRSGSRLVDLERGIVAPLVAEPVHFSRIDPRGQCPMCHGRGEVLTLPEHLVVRDPHATPEDEGFLCAPAAAVMKGVRRSELAPFLRRLSDEGLWDRSSPYAALAATDRDLLLFGCWTRPGHGTFLKSSKEDPSEVGAWLRWDGLYDAIWAQHERSPDAKWKVAVAASRQSRPCPFCGGTGLASQAKLLRLAGRSLHDWVREGTLAELRQALEAMRTFSPRQQRTQERLLACVAPLEKTGFIALREMMTANRAREMGQRVVEAFTTMQAIFA